MKNKYIKYLIIVTTLIISTFILIFLFSSDQDKEVLHKGDVKVFNNKDYIIGDSSSGVTENYMDISLEELMIYGKNNELKLFFYENGPELIYLNLCEETNKITFKCPIEGFQSFTDNYSESTNIKLIRNNLPYFIKGNTKVNIYKSGDNVLLIFNKNDK